MYSSFLLKSEVFSDCICLPPRLAFLLLWGLGVSHGVVFHLCVSAGKASGARSGSWLVVAAEGESVWVLAHPAQLGRREQAWPGHRLRGCDSASLLPESKEGQSWAAETNHSAETSPPVSPELKRNQPRLSRCTSYLMEDIPAKSQALLSFCLTSVVLEWCWGSWAVHNKAMWSLGACTFSVRQYHLCCDVAITCQELWASLQAVSQVFPNRRMVIPLPPVWQLVHPISQPVFLCRRISSCGIWDAFAFAHCFWSAGGTSVSGMAGCPGILEGRAWAALASGVRQFTLATQPAMVDERSQHMS